MVIELIAKDKKEKFQFQGRCKLVIDSVSKFLLVEPVNEEYKMISAVFKWKFVAQKNIIFVFAEHSFQDFALVFDNPKKCKKIYAIIIKKGATAGNKELIDQRFWPSMVEQISTNNEKSLKLKEAILKWIEFHDKKEKKKYIQILKDKAYEMIFSSLSKSQNDQPCKQRTNIVSCKRNDKNINNDSSNEMNSTRKPEERRKRQREIETSEDVIESSNYKIFKYNHNGKSTSKLIVFSATNKNLCYEYYRCGHQKYVCSKCPSKYQVTATVHQKTLSLSKNQHDCDLLEFDPDKYKDDIIINKSMYYITITTLRMAKYNIINVFSSEDKKFYYKFCRVKKYYYCSKCYYSYKEKITATIQNEGKENEFLYVSNQKHVCEPFEYSTLTNGNIIRAPNFQFIKRKHNHKIIQHLAVFTNNEKTECYEYTWNEKCKHFRCHTCHSHHKNSVYAKMFKNDTNEECVELSENLHKCKSMKFVPENIASKIVKLPNYQLIKRNHNNKIIQHLAVFTSNEKTECYEYTWNEKCKHFLCYTCQKHHKIYVYAKMFKNDENEECIELSENLHKCKPLNFVSENLTSKIVKLPNYQLIKRKHNNKIIQHLAVFTNNEKTECYEYTWNENKKYFICYTCLKHHKIYVYAKMFKNDANEECVELSENLHKCKPLNFVSENLTSKIVKAPNFKLYETVFCGKNVKRLAIFDLKKKNFEFIYYYDKSKNHYFCQPCSKKSKSVTAKVLKDENGEDYVELNKNEHVCELQKI